MTENQAEKPRVVSQAEWLAAHEEFLKKEKEFTRERDALSAERRKLPWVKVDKDYVFDSADGPKTLGDLFNGKSQLIVQHFMLGPGAKQGCPSCSLLADHLDGMLVHMAQRDVAMAAVSRGTLSEIATFQKRMGWGFPWVSSNGNDFNRDYHVSFTKEEIAAGTASYNYGPYKFGSEEAPGLSVFFRDEAGEIFHTYSTYARGLDILLGVYNFLDLTPRGRDEGSLPYPMAWIRHHDRYADTGLVGLAAV
jgi:predicted dithiol-disulfide oxidoreductase (DUF899 family)